jgi:hypothetical protein
MANLREIIKLFPVPLNDDGSRGIHIPPEVADSAVQFFDALPDVYKNKIRPLDHLSPTAHGTIVFDFAVRKNFVSIEIGAGQIGIFTFLPDGSTPSLNSELNPATISIAVSCLKSLYQ